MASHLVPKRFYYSTILGKMQEMEGTRRVGLIGLKGNWWGIYVNIISGGTLRILWVQDKLLCFLSLALSRSFIEKFYRKSHLGMVAKR